MKQMDDGVYELMRFCGALVLLEVVVLIAVVGLIEVIGWMI